MLDTAAHLEAFSSLILVGMERIFGLGTPCAGLLVAPRTRDWVNTPHGTLWGGALRARIRNNVSHHNFVLYVHPLIYPAHLGAFTTYSGGVEIVPFALHATPTETRLAHKVKGVPGGVDQGAGDIPKKGG